jgi:hypothetical protein
MPGANAMNAAADAAKIAASFKESLRVLILRPLRPGAVEKWRRRGSSPELRTAHRHNPAASLGNLAASADISTMSGDKKTRGTA